MLWMPTHNELSYPRDTAIHVTDTAHTFTRGDLRRSRSRKATHMLEDNDPGVQDVVKVGIACCVVREVPCPRVLKGCAKLAKWVVL